VSSGGKSNAKTAKAKAHTAVDFHSLMGGNKDSGDGEKASEEEKEEDEDDEDGDDSDDDSEEEPEKKSFSRVEEVNAFRNAMQIKVSGSDIPNPITTFDDMQIDTNVKSVVLRNIEESAWKEPTAIQMQAIPAMLSGRDVLAAAPTGSGKTAAFVVPVLSRVSSILFGSESSSSGVKNKKKSKEKMGIKALLLAPTRELVEQIHREAVRLCTGKRIKISLLKKSTSSMAQSKQDKSAFLSYDVLVSTPMRLVSLIRAGAIDLNNVEIIALDEADKLLELNDRNSTTGGDDETNEDLQDDSRSSFLTQVDEILAACPSTGVQRALFSATIGPFVSELASQFLRNAVRITIGTENSGASTINQRLVFVGREDGKLLAIRQLVQEGLKPPVLLFVQSIERAKELFRELVYDGINVDIIHAEKSQQQREDLIRRFRTGDVWVLICTELMARGVDFKGVQMVINYDLPQSSVAYIHRIGRTGRAGQKGTSVTFFTEDDIPRLRSIANVVKLSGCYVPDWMLTIPKLTTKQKRVLKKSAPSRRNISTSQDKNSQKENGKKRKR